MTFVTPLLSYSIVFVINCRRLSHTTDCEVLQAYLLKSLFKGESFPSYAPGYVSAAVNLTTFRKRSLLVFAQATRKVSIPGIRSSSSCVLGLVRTITSSVCSVTIGGALAGRAGSFRVTSLLKARSFDLAMREAGNSA
jgi:hypothetical protein